MTIFNDTNLSETTNFGDIVRVVNADILGGALGWAWLLMIFVVLFTITRSQNSQNSLSFAAIGTTVSSLFLTALGILPAYYILLCVLILAGISVAKFLNPQN